MLLGTSAAALANLNITPIRGLDLRRTLHALMEAYQQVALPAIFIRHRTIVIDSGHLQSPHRVARCCRG